MVVPARSVNTTGPPALITVGACAVKISVPRLNCCAAMPTTTSCRWVVRAAVYIDQFMAASKVIAIRRAGLVKGSRDFAGLTQVWVEGSKGRITDVETAVKG